MFMATVVLADNVHYKAKQFSTLTVKRAWNNPSFYREMSRSIGWSGVNANGEPTVVTLLVFYAKSFQYPKHCVMVGCVYKDRKCHSPRIPIAECYEYSDDIILSLRKYAEKNNLGTKK